MHFYESKRDELYDLGADLNETRNLAMEKPQQVGILRAKLSDYLTRVGAQFPIPNPQYDPANPPTSLQKGNKSKPPKGKKPRKGLRLRE